LKNPPEYAVLFTRLGLIEVLINSISLPIATAARAPGKMKIYEFTLGCIQLMIFIVSWVVLKMGTPAYSVFVVAIVANLVMFVVRLLIVRTLIGLPIDTYLRQVVLPVLLVTLVSVIPSYGLHLILPKGFIFTGIIITSSIIITTASMYRIGLDKELREKVRSIIVNRINGIFKLSLI
jgi:hypothetical protein